jgi:ATP-dependent Clp protease protease subunit
MGIPYIYEENNRGGKTYDIFSRLMVDRIIFLGYPIDDAYANAIIGSLLYLDAENPDRDIYIYINSPGGYISSGLAIYDTMQHIQSDIRTICIGQAASMAALILAGGTKGKRFALPHSRIMLHQPTGGATGQASDIEIQANEIIRLKAIINGLFQNHTGKTIEEIERDTDRDFYMTPEEAKNYGLIDMVIPSKKSVREQGVIKA